MNELTISTLKSKLNNLKDYFEKYNPENVEKIEKIDSYIGQQVFKIAVVANMSAGKSTFVNALFGAKVLPAYTQATTDCATFIHSEPNCDKKAIIYFNDGKQNVELADDTLGEIKNYARKDKDCKDDKYKNVERIDLYYPFKNLQTSSNEDFKILFVDTPGPNSTGGDYAQKHKDQTRSVLNDVNLALFLFDYEQLDANLSSDDQGLWNTIKTRCEGDKDFDVYFLLNKIDAAFKDYDQDIDEQDEEKFIEAKKNKWFEHEGEAIEKLRQAAKKHDIEDPKVYPLSSEFALLKRNEHINFGKKNKLHDFQTDHFKMLFPDNWEEKLIEYLGIEKLENDINDYISSVVKSKIINRLNNATEEIIAEEHNNLERRIETLKKPREEAETNLKAAKEFLENESKKLQEEMKAESSQLHEQYSKEIENKIDAAIKKELKNKANEVVERSIYFLERICTNGDAVSFAIKNAKRLPYDKIPKRLSGETLELSAPISVKHEETMEQMRVFMVSILRDFQNNYLDVKTDIKESYHRFNMSSSILLKKYKDKLEENLNQSLKVKANEIAKEEVESLILSGISDIEIADSGINYKFKRAQYKEEDFDLFSPSTWFFRKTVKVSDDEHVFVIESKKILNIVNNAIQSHIDTFYNPEIEKHNNALNTYLRGLIDIFQDFRHEKEKEIKRLGEEIKNSDTNLEKIGNQKREFEMLQDKE